MTFELTCSTASGYVERAKLGIEESSYSCKRLGGGVSNQVVEVSWDNGCIVLKQPFPNLDVDDDWPADVDRVHNEAAAARAIRRLLRSGGVDDVDVPAVRIEDEKRHVIGLDCVPTEATMWKRELLDGRVDLNVARSLGRALGVVHTRAATDDELRTRFLDSTPFEQLRLEPYHRTVAKRHPQLAKNVLAETDRIASVDRTLVHGDFSPKNVLVQREGNSPIAWLIDFEVAHWGDPAFDVAFIANHLFIKALYRANSREDLLEAASAVWSSYRVQVDWEIEAEVATEVAVLMLARVDGKSPVEYVEEGPVADAMRRVGTRTLQEQIGTIREIAEIVRVEAP